MRNINMVIFKDKIKEMGLGFYALVFNPDTSLIETKVVCPSGLASKAWFNYLDALRVKKDITALHRQHLEDCSHNGKPLPIYLFVDTEIGTNSIDIAEMKNFIDNMGMGFYFENDNTLLEMVNTLSSLGYYFQRKTSNNI